MPRRKGLRACATRWSRWSRRDVRLSDWQRLRESSGSESRCRSWVPSCPLLAMNRSSGVWAALRPEHDSEPVGRGSFCLDRVRSSRLYPAGRVNFVVDRNVRRAGDAREFRDLRNLGVALEKAWNFSAVSHSSMTTSSPSPATKVWWMIPAPFVSSVISSRSAALACKAATAFSMSATGKRAMTVTLMTATSFEWPDHLRRGGPAKLRHFCCAHSECREWRRRLT